MYCVCHWTWIKVTFIDLLLCVSYRQAINIGSPRNKRPQITVLGSGRSALRSADWKDMRQRCWQSVFFCLWKGFWEYQELLICCIPSSLQWLVCALRPAGEAFYFCGGYSEIKGPIYLQFLCYCRTGFFTLKKITTWVPLLWKREYLLWSRFVIINLRSKGHLLTKPSDISGH